MPDPLPPHRSLIALDEKSLISPDTFARITTLAEANAATLKVQSNLKTYLFPVAIGFLLFGLFVAFSGAGEVGQFLVLCAVVIGVFGALTANHRDKHIEELSTISFPCPRCHTTINLAEPWICGNCKHENGTDPSELSIPFIKCLHPKCSQPQQSAHQCPECHHHIVFNQALYLSSKSYETPYPAVARYTADTKTPVPAKPLKTHDDSFLDGHDDPFAD